MHVDDTKDRIYIRSLEEELAEDEAEDQSIYFLADIDRTLASIPQAVFSHGNAAQSPTTDLVLYQVPSSLSVPKERDNVRKIMLEARERARQKGNGTTDRPGEQDSADTNNQTTNGNPAEQEDGERTPPTNEDYMDIE